MSNDDELRKAAKQRLKARQDLRTYLFVWAVVSGIVSGIWLLGTPGAPFWPIWTIAGMGVAVPFIAWNAYGQKTVISEADIDAEVKKMTGGV